MSPKNAPHDPHDPHAPSVAPEFSRTVHVHELSTVDKVYAFEATPGELAALAQRLGVDALDALRVKAELHILPNKDVWADFSFAARVRQRCVVTLEPMNSDISSSFTTTYSENADQDWGHDEEEFEDFEADFEPPEPLVGGVIDVGEACVEQLALEIDPFPRVQGATFEGYSTDLTADSRDGNIAAVEKKNPFAVLSKLKTQKENEE